MILPIKIHHSRVQRGDRVITLDRYLYCIVELSDTKSYKMNPLSGYDCLSHVVKQAGRVCEE